MGSLTPESLGQLIDAHAAALRLYAAQWTDSAADVVQEAYVELLRQHPVPSPVAPWLYRVVRNRAINSARAAQRRRHHESAAASMTRSWFEPSASALIEAAEVTQALKELPGEQREAIVARLWSGLTFDEIAAISGTAASTACRRYQAGIAALRKKLVSPWLSKQTKSGPLDDFERALASLTPRAGGVNRDQLMFLAGQAAVRPTPSCTARRQWLWPMSTAASLAAALAMGLLLAADRGVVVSETDSRGAGPPGQSGPSRAAGEVATDDAHRRLPPIPMAGQLPGVSDWAAADRGPADAGRATVEMLRLRRVLLDGGLDGLPRASTHSSNRVVASSTYWEASRQLMPRSWQEDPDRRARGGFLRWRHVFMRGDTL